MNTQESNILIAEFDSLMIPDETEAKGDSWYRSGEWKCIYHLKYHTSWDWLMPVVEKIEDIDVRGVYAVTIGWGISCQIVFMDETDHPMINVESANAKTKIEAVYSAVVQFITWYNANKPQTP